MPSPYFNQEDEELYDIGMTLLMVFTPAQLRAVQAATSRGTDIVSEVERRRMSRFGAPPLCAPMALGRATNANSIEAMQRTMAAIMQSQYKKAWTAEDWARLFLSYVAGFSAPSDAIVKEYADRFRPFVMPGSNDQISEAVEFGQFLRYWAEREEMNGQLDDVMDDWLERDFTADEKQQWGGPEDAVDEYLAHMAYMGGPEGVYSHARSTPYETYDESGRGGIYGGPVYSDMYVDGWESGGHPEVIDVDAWEVDEMGGRRRKRRGRLRNFFRKAFKRVGKVAKKVGKFVKKSKLLKTVAPAILAATGFGAPAAAALTAATAGISAIRAAKKRKKRRRRGGPYALPPNARAEAARARGVLRAGGPGGDDPDPDGVSVHDDMIEEKITAALGPRDQSLQGLSPMEAASLQPPSSWVHRLLPKPNC